MCLCIWCKCVCLSFTFVYVYIHRYTDKHKQSSDKTHINPHNEKNNININIIIERCFTQKIFYATLLRYRAAVATFLKLISLLDTETRRVCAVASLITLMRILEETLKPLSHDSG